jgi:hypothetical protein
LREFPQSLQSISRREAQGDLPDRLIFRNPVKPALQKYFAFSEAQINCMVRAVPCSPGGRFAIVTKRGAGCDGRVGVHKTKRIEADGEIAWS